MAAEASRASSVREQTTAPRIPAHITSMAATFAAAAEDGRGSKLVAAAIDCISKYEVNDSRPFGGAAEDMAHSALTQAHALTVMLGNAFDEQHDHGDGGSTYRAVHIARTFDALSSLISLALMANEGAAS